MIWITLNYEKIKTFMGDVIITPTQRKVIVDFKDEEHMYGTCLTYGKFKTGFFIYPIDTNDNSERIFVVHSATKRVRLMKIDI